MNVEELMNNIKGVKTSNQYTDPNIKRVTQIVTDNLLTKESVDAKIYDKYEDRGVLWNPKAYASGSLDKQLADAQSNWAKAGNALAQTLVSEVLLGTAIGFSDLVDIVTGAAFQSDNDYSNPISKTLTEWQEKFRNEVAPIYAKQGESWGDFGWWMQHIPSIASSISLAVPAATVTKGLSLAAKGIKTATSLGKSSRKASKVIGQANKLTDVPNTASLPIASNIAEWGKDATKAVITGGMMRFLENYQESRQVYSDMFYEAKETLDAMSDEEYNNFIKNNINSISKESGTENIDISNKDSVAKAIANASADETFKYDWSNVVFDIAQLLTLRRMTFNTFRKPITTSRQYKTIDRYSRKNPNASPDELKQILKDRSIKTKVSDYVKDGLTAAGVGIGVQLSEGVEEGVNFIAQQEGMYLGRTLLNLQNESTFNRRFNEYLNNPELWESAFWGVLGGVVFQSVGSKVNQVKAAKKLVNETKGKPNELKFWTAFRETADSKRAIASIQHRLNINEEYKRKLDLVHNKNKNPYTDLEIQDDVEKGIILNRLLNDRRQQLIFNAFSNGTIDMLESFIQDDNVKQALIDNNIVKENEIDNIVKEDLNAISYYKNTYKKVIKNLNKASANIAKTKGIRISSDYLQIIAMNNIARMNNVEQLNEQLRLYENEVLEEKNNLEDELDPTINYRELALLNRYTAKLGELNATKRELIKNIKDDISKEQTLKDLDDQIETVKDLIYELNSELASDYLLYSLKNSAKTYIENDKYESSTEYLDKEIKDIFEKKTLDIDSIKKLDKRLDSITENSLHFINLTEQNTRLAFSDNEIHKQIDKHLKELDDKKKSLKEGYITIAELKFAINFNKKQTYSTDDKILNEANQLYNYIDATRVKAIQDAVNTLVDSAKEYGSDFILELINNSIKGENYNWDSDKKNKEVTDNDKNEITQALDVLQLSEELNMNLIPAVINRVKHADDVVKATQPNTKNKKQSSTTKKSKQDKSSQNETKSTQPTPQETTNQSSAEKPKENTIDSKQNLIDLVKAEYQLTDNDFTLEHKPESETSFELIIHDINKHTSLLDPNKHLFDVPNNVTPLNNNLIITTNPIININGEIELEGLINLNTEESVNIKNQIEEENIQKQKQIEEANTQPHLTRVQDNTTSDDPLQYVPEDDNIDDHIINGEINSSAIKDLKNYKTSNSNATLEDFTKFKDDLIEQYKENYKDKIKPGSKLNVKTIVDNVFNRFKRKYFNDASEIFRLASINENNSNQKLIDEIKKLLNNINSGNFKDKSGNEIQLVHLESLLRFLNTILFTDEGTNINEAITNEEMLNAARKIIDVIENSKEIKIIDEKPKNIEYNIKSKSENIIHEEYVSGINYFSTLTKLNVENLPKEEQNKIDNSRKKLYDAVDKLDIGNEIKVKQEDSRFIFYVIDNNEEIVLGELPMYSITTNGVKYQYNNFWKTEVLPYNEKSNLEKFYISLFDGITSNDVNAKQLHDTILKYIYNIEDKETLIKDFKNNPLIQKAVKDGLTSNPPNDINDLDVYYNELLIGMSELVKYVYAYKKSNTYESLLYDTESSDVSSIIIDNYKESISNWFEKVKESFNFLDSLRDNPNHKVIIDNISDGEWNFTANNTEYSSLEDVISSFGEAHIGMIQQVNGITTLVSPINAYIEQNYKVTENHPYVLLPNKHNGNYKAVNCTIQPLSDIQNNNLLKNILNVFKNELAAAKDDNGKLDLFTINNILTELFCATNKKLDSNKNALFRTKPQPNGIMPVSYFNEDKKITIQINFDTNKRKNKDKNPSESVIIINENGVSIINKNNPNGSTIKIEDIIDYIIPQLFTHINKHAINNSTSTLRYENNKLALYINDKLYKEFNSYADFIKQINGIKVGISKQNGRYINRYVRNDKTKSQNIKVKLAKNNDRVEEIDTTNKTDNAKPVSNLFTTEETTISIVNILNDNSVTHKGKALYDFLGYSYSNTLFSYDINNSNLFLKLLPKNIIFVPNSQLPDNIDKSSTNAFVDLAVVKNKKENTPIYITERWIELANNPNTRNEAIRKLIHEQIHVLLNIEDNSKFIKKIQEVYEEFEKEFNKNKTDIIEKYINSFNSYKNENGSENTIVKLEEFVVESLTSVEFANYLNNIEVYKRNSKTSLLNAIFDIIFELLGLNLNKKSLYAKELKTLNDVFNNINTNTTNEEAIVKTDETTTNEDIASPPVTDNESTEDEENSELNDDYSGILDEIDINKDIVLSSIKEHNTIDTFMTSFDNNDKIKIQKYVDNGIIEISCKL